jgi:hypothetical protein
MLGEQTGAGDTFAAIAKAVGAEWVAKKVEQVTGKPCGCKKRQEALNRLVPYKPKEGPSRFAESERSWG